MNKTLFPKITFGIIVLNGEPFTRYCLRSIYPFAYEIIVVEGGHVDARSVCTPDGHSVDGPGRVETRTMFGRVWPRWWPLVAICRGEKERNRTILVSHVFPVGTAALISKCLGGPDYSVIVHGLDVRLARGTWKRWLLKHICKNAKAVIANSESTKNDLLAIVPGVTVTVLTPAVDGAPYPSREDARRMLGIGPDEKVVLTVARLVPRKGVDMSIRAMARIQAKQDVRYVVIGEGSDRGRNVRAEGVQRSRRRGRQGIRCPP